MVYLYSSLTGVLYVDSPKETQNITETLRWTEGREAFSEKSGEAHFSSMAQGYPRYLNNITEQTQH